MTSTPTAPNQGGRHLVGINGWAVRELRNHVRKTAQQLAAEALVGRPYITQIENHKRTRVSPPVLEGIAKALGVDPRTIATSPSEVAA